VSQIFSGHPVYTWGTVIELRVKPLRHALGMVDVGKNELKYGIMVIQKQN